MLGSRGSERTGTVASFRSRLPSASPGSKGGSVGTSCLTGGLGPSRGLRAPGALDTTLAGGGAFRRRGRRGGGRRPGGGGRVALHRRRGRGLRGRGHSCG